MPDTAAMSLYHKSTCPYCLRVRWAMHRLGLGLDIELRSTFDPQHRADLVAGGGQSMVPCLRIDHPGGQTQWMYESADIVDYLRTIAE
jgi:glutathione S-transferase